MYSITIPDACFQGIDRWTNVGRQALGRFSWNGKDLRHMIFIISYLRQCISPAPCNLKETCSSMLSRSKVALQKVVNQNYIIVLNLYWWSLSQMTASEIMFSNWRKHIHPCGCPDCHLAWYLLGRCARGQEEEHWGGVRHCHVLEHDFKYMDAVNNALCRTLVISFQWGKRELLNATGLGIPTF